MDMNSMDDRISLNNSSPSDDIALQDDAVVDSDVLQEDEPCPEDHHEDQRHLRSVFTYPVELAVFTSRPEPVTFGGYLRDISTGGACVEFEDQHGRCDIQELKSAKVKISFTILEKEKVDIFAQVKWVKKAADGAAAMKIGAVFKHMESWDAIDKLIGMKNKDRNMMWNLWEQLLK